MKISEYIRKCDGAFRDRLYFIADDLCRQMEGERKIKLVCLSGPTCSGKTTAAAMLVRRLARNGHIAHLVSIDDFYYDRDHLHKLSAQKEHGSIDYDSPDTIDITELERFVEEAFSDREIVHCPTFDFKTGNRSGFRELRVGETDVFIFEGIQAIYPEITRLFAPHGFKSVCIAPETPIRVGPTVFEPNEIRYLRRLVRDRNFRNTDAEFTMHLWESVRSNEDIHIFPYISGCDYLIDSTMPYEIGVLKPYLTRMLSVLNEQSPCYGEAQRILKNISHIEPIDSSLIEEDSLYREFV